MRSGSRTTPFPSTRLAKFVHFRQPVHLRRANMRLFQSRRRTPKLLSIPCYRLQIQAPGAFASAPTTCWHRPCRCARGHWSMMDANSGPLGLRRMVRRTSTGTRTATCVMPALPSHLTPKVHGTCNALTSVDASPVMEDKLSKQHQALCASYWLTDARAFAFCLRIATRRYRPGSWVWRSVQLGT